MGRDFWGTNRLLLPCEKDVWNNNIGRGKSLYIRAFLFVVYLCRQTLRHLTAACTLRIGRMPFVFPFYLNLALPILIHVFSLPHRPRRTIEDAASSSVYDR